MASPATSIFSDTILERMAALGDPIRCRILVLLEGHELSVSELCTVLQLPQSTVSRHLKILLTDGWVDARKDGTSRLYSARHRTSESARELWSLVSSELASSSTVDEDRRRVEGVLARRSSGSRAFFSSAAHQWAELRQDLFGRRFDLEALLGLLDSQLVIGDLGTGTGQVVEALAPHVRRVIAIDESPEMLDAASGRLAGLANVELRHGRLEALPLKDEELDVALLMLVMHHLPEPPRVFSEAARVLKPGGRFLIVDMLSHDREDYRREMGHIWLGFTEAQIVEWFENAGFEAVHFRPGRLDPEMRGPSIFSATATRWRSHAPHRVATAETVPA
ncbi:MAG: metalloregulator ArsR/SmtB family transcription factor [Acidobacteriota bacterium]|nr:metalloregulator ArsR/SmtB family transcription factor [Acidobacteriota bacterium]